MYSYLILNAELAQKHQVMKFNEAIHYFEETINDFFLNFGVAKESQTISQTIGSKQRDF